MIDICWIGELSASVEYALYAYADHLNVMTAQSQVYHLLACIVLATLVICAVTVLLFLTYCIVSDWMDNLKSKKSMRKFWDCPCGNEKKEEQTNE